MYIMELKGKQARSFIEKMKNPPPNPARDETIRRAKAIMKKLEERKLRQRIKL